MKYQTKPVVFEALTFDELVEHGRNSPGVNIVNGMPWSFALDGKHITHENDDCYLVPTMDDPGIVNMGRGDILSYLKGGPCSVHTKAEFHKRFIPAPPDAEISLFSYTES